ncbi:MAG: enoyl-CoA hydratase-related protein, partial [Ardenticatenales bacterium]
MAYEFILVHRDGPVGIVQFNRPDKLNALSPALIAEMADALESLDADAAIGAIVLTGNERAFAAGADIGEMVEANVVDQIRRDMFATWDRVRR